MRLKGWSGRQETTLPCADRDFRPAVFRKLTNYNVTLELSAYAPRKFANFITFEFLKTSYSIKFFK
jgi:hypothetical protein